MSSSTEWISAIANSISAIGIFFAAYSVYFASKQISADHKRSRRERAVDLLIEWSTRLNRRGSISRKFVEHLDEVQARDLCNEDPVTKIDIKYKDLVIGCLHLADQERIKDWDQKGEINLDEKESAAIRWEVVSYLNTLETILVAWRHNIADREIITEQFGYLVSKQKGLSILEKFREAAGGSDAYPGIDEFYKHLTKDKSQSGQKVTG